MIVLAPIFAALIASPPAAQDRAAQHEERAQRHFEAGEFERARDEILAARELRPNVDQLYKLGRIAVELGDCAGVHRYFDDFLEGKGPAASEESRRAIGTFKDDCPDDTEPEADPAAPGPEAPRPEPPPPTPPNSDGAGSESAAPRRHVDAAAWHRDVLGGVLLGVGTATAATGAVLLGIGVGEGLHADEAPNEDAFRSSQESSQRLRIAGAATLAAGGIAIVAAIIRYALVARALKGKRRSPR